MQNHAGSPIVNVRVPQAVVDYLDTLAAETGTARSTLVRAAVQQVTPAHLWAAEQPDHRLAAGTAVAAEMMRQRQQVHQ
jgi:predicted transcriptional regulator